METSKLDNIKLFLANIYTPKSKQVERASLADFLKQVNVRSFNVHDQGRIGLSVLRIVTSAQGQYETFKTWEVSRCDCWTISNEFVTFALYDDDGNAKPYKVSLHNPRFAILC